MRFKLSNMLLEVNSSGQVYGQSLNRQVASMSEVDRIMMSQELFLTYRYETRFLPLLTYKDEHGNSKLICRQSSIDAAKFPLYWKALDVGASVVVSRSPDCYPAHLCTIDLYDADNPTRCCLALYPVERRFQDYVSGHWSSPKMRELLQTHRRGVGEALLSVCTGFLGCEAYMAKLRMAHSQSYLPVSKLLG